jgi:hypothetical protein
MSTFGEDEKSMNPDNTTHTSSQTISLADEEAVKQTLVRTIFGLWEIVNDLTRLRPSKRERYRVTIFGSARAQPGTPAEATHLLSGLKVAQ